MRRRVARVELDRSLEVGDRGWHLGRIERLQAHAPLGERAVGLEAARVAERSRLLRPDPQRLGKLRHDPILQLEDLLERTVGLGLGRRFPARGIDHARGNPQPRARPLKASDDGEVEVQLGPERRKIRAAAPHRLHDAHAIDDAQRRGGPQIVGHGLGDAGGQPRQLAVAADVGEVEDGNRRLLRRCDRSDPVSAAAPERVAAAACVAAVVVTGAMNRYPRRATVWM